MVPPALSAKPLLRKLLRLSLLILLFMATAGIGAYLALTLIIKGEEAVIIPDLVGKDVLYGLEILSDLGLNTRVRGTAYHEQVPKNHVIDQDPEAGATIKRGRDVKIRVSKGPESIVMPNLTGLSLQQGRILLTENGLCQGTLAAMAGHHLAGQIIAQHPPPGSTISRNDCADLLVSRGPVPRSFPMPELAGWPLEKALRRLEEIRLNVGRIRISHMARIPPETIVEQTPLSGDRVIPGSHVDLTVNRSRKETDAGQRHLSDPGELFRFTLANGFLNKRVRVAIDQPQMSLNLFDDFMAPGQEIWLLIPKGDTSTVLVYVDGQLINHPDLN